MSSVRRPTSRAAIRVYSLTVQRTARGGRGSRPVLAISVILAPGQADLAAQVLERHVGAGGDRRLTLAHPGQLLLAEWRVFFRGEPLGVFQQLAHSLLVELVDQLEQFAFRRHQ